MATSGKTLIISSIITPCTPNPSITTQKTPEDHLSHAFTGFDHLAVPKETTYYSTYNEMYLALFFYPKNAYKSTITLYTTNSWK